MSVDDPISEVIGQNAFYLQLQSGDQVIYNDGISAQTILIGGVTSSKGIVGNMVAVFTDINSNNIVELNELTGLSLGKNVTATISGSVYGDIVTNYNDFNGRIGGTTESLGFAEDLLLNTLGNLLVSGNVEGRVISGGDIINLKVIGSVDRVLAGAAANAVTFDFNTSMNSGGANNTLSVSPSAKVKGISIKGATLGSLNLMEAGGGGEGAIGGSISNITLLDDTDGFIIRAGAGGAGDSIVASGGTGGSVSNILANGRDIDAQDTTQNDQIEVSAGVGGAGSTTKLGKGGNGGFIKDVYISYERVSGSSTPVISAVPLRDQVLVQGGDGGAGKIGGNGGAVTKSKIFASPNGASEHIEVYAGDGGNSDYASIIGKAGSGGSVSSVELLNPDVLAVDSKLIIQGGDGGATILFQSAGGNGGNITSSKLIGTSVDIRGGNGSDGGKTGGNGGSLSNLLFEKGASGSKIQNAIIDGGRGGTGTTGKGGNGGSISNITITDADIQGFSINGTALASNGGASQKGVGGKGGSVAGINLNESQGEGTGNEGLALIKSGSGGDSGSLGNAGNGGAAGSISNIQFDETVGLSFEVVSGDGGDAVFKGNGGIGGSLKAIAFNGKEENELAPVVVSAVVTSGSGGGGRQTGPGGAAGNITTINIILGRKDITGVDLDDDIIRTVSGGDIGITAGSGGDAQAGVGGRGGSLLSVGGETYAGAVTFTAGDAGLGGKKSLGGNITSANLSVGTNAFVQAGDGAFGGAGGNIKSVGVFRAVRDADMIGVLTADLGSAPTGSVSILAGNGSGGGKVAGLGGSITDIAGFIGITGLTEIKAGNGGAIDAKSNKGGSISQVNIFGGGSATAEVEIVAGNGGDNFGMAQIASVKTGAAGGNITDINIGIDLPGTSVYSMDPGTIIRHIAAGNGGNTSLINGKGGAGGSVSGVSVNGDIGVRSGESFGFSTMGGVFAGAGGANVNILTIASPTQFAATDGKSGSVSKIIAHSIASIVAGRPDVGDVFEARNIVEALTDVTLLGLENPTKTNPDGSYANFDTANVLGGVVNPLDAGANTFSLADGEFADNDGSGFFSIGDSITSETDGFVAAKVFKDSERNVRPEALLRVNADTGVIEFIDLTNANGQTPA